MGETLKPGEEEVQKEKIICECESCRGTGIITNVGTGELGIGMVCIGCNGSGQTVSEYVPFNGRKQRTDIKIVKAMQLSLAPGINPVGEGISYEEFLAGKRPTP